VSDSDFRQATSDDAFAVAELYAASGISWAPASAGEFEVMLQTGHAFLIAAEEAGVLGAVRHQENEGIGSFDLLVSSRPWAGAQLVRAVERLCQDRGIRLVRCRCPDSAIFEDYFARLGYLPIGRDFGDAGEPQLLLERRLPLLTVREQRRSDADAIGALTGDDPWVFGQGSRPGAFVAADGEKVVGFIQCSEAVRGIARVGVPALAEPYRGRGLELWMISRAAEYAETNGYHSAEMGAATELDALGKGLEERFWVRERDAWRRVFFTPSEEGEEEW